MDTTLMTVSDVAMMCQVSTKTVRRAIARGELSAARLGSRAAYRLRHEDVDAWIADRLVARPRSSSGTPTPKGWLTT
jgi:excisionase family DNA binding protein